MALARDIDASPSFPQGYDDRNCVFDDGTAAAISFQYAGGRTEWVFLELAGCGDLWSPGLFARDASAAVYRDLKPYAPHPWNTYVSARAR
ncbi:hypothetical protein Back2_12590 [Nocardioides baekrokdamisoli]|uniref:Uncharacterized protein n=1 Tax=Nocardioides baekrokdamisoli TaxID=1804624 RepID=A0A3G9IF75_9ACTN|nr:hypothetical protein [Nocardioides baekrokdamisoli]BBH16972.1 hypothetical protein Back2_12590 [Nocardioides baekrokdamisoli]